MRSGLAATIRTDAGQAHGTARRAGSISEQAALLFRDYLRTHPEWCAEYGDVKHRLAQLLVADRHRYVEAKAPFVWETIHLADHPMERVHRI